MALQSWHFSVLLGMFTCCTKYPLCILSSISALLSSPLYCRGWKTRNYISQTLAVKSSGCKFESTNGMHSYNKVRQRPAPTSQADAVVETWVSVQDPSVGSFMRKEMQQWKPPDSLFSSLVTGFMGAKWILDPWMQWLWCVLRSAAPGTASRFLSFLSGAEKQQLW